MLLIAPVLRERGRGRGSMTEGQFMNCLDHIEDLRLANSLWSPERSPAEKQRAWKRLKQFVDALNCNPPFETLDQLKTCFANKRTYMNRKMGAAQRTGNGRVPGLNPLEQHFQNILDQVEGIAKGKTVSLSKLEWLIHLSLIDYFLVYTLKIPMLHHNHLQVLSNLLY